MPATEHPGGDLERHDLEHPHRPPLEQELKLERRSRAWFHAAEKGGLQWRQRSPNQRFVAHRRGNR
jgi:hypothetical protein